MRVLFTLYLGLVWLIVPYPYGLWLFALSVYGYYRQIRATIDHASR